ncbi:MAG: hypothetical protein K9G49_16835 [Taibaiella sp.]|nr:hypothetical protein [Taibaiella sp.]
MQIWKQILLTVSLFSAIISTAILTSCEKNSCDGITCYNGGACGHGACNCPTGYEDPQCGTKSITRYLGTYGGFTTCDNGAHTIDTVTVVAANRGILSVDVYYKSIYPKVLYGYVSSNESTYTINVTNNDSAKAGSLSYLRVFTITVQSDKTLKLHTFEHNYTATIDTFQSSCEFLGTKIVYN